MGGILGAKSFMVGGLVGKTIVISGGTKGVGTAVALACVQESARVVIGGRDEAAAQDILAQITELGGEGLFVPTDLRKTKDCQRLFDAAHRCFGRIDGFFNYAGITPAASLLESTEDDFNAIFDINIRAAFFCCQHAVRYMQAVGGGSIVLTGYQALGRTALLGGQQPGRDAFCDRSLRQCAGKQWQRHSQVSGTNCPGRPGDRHASGYRPLFHDYP